VEPPSTGYGVRGVFAGRRVPVNDEVADLDKVKSRPARKRRFNRPGPKVWLNCRPRGLDIRIVALHHDDRLGVRRDLFRHGGIRVGEASTGPRNYARNILLVGRHTNGVVIGFELERIGSEVEFGVCRVDRVAEVNHVWIVHRAERAGRASTDRRLSALGECVFESR
jgi:hypothetical protein